MSPEDSYRNAARARFLLMLSADPEAWHHVPESAGRRLAKAGLVQWRGRRGTRLYRVRPDIRLAMRLALSAADS